MKEIFTVISYCSLDKPFITPCINEALKCSEHVVIVYGDKFLDGITPDSEAESYLKEITQNQSRISLVKIFVTDVESKTQRYYHNLFRETGYHFLLENFRDSITNLSYVLFLDADEIIEGATLYNQYPIGFSMFSLDCYWYFREPIYRAVQQEQAGVAYSFAILKKYPQILQSSQERWAFRDMRDTVTNVYEHFRNRETNLPLCHHFSWARTKNQMIQKVKSWAHSTDRDWIPAIEQEFTHPFNGQDFIHNYQYVQVPNIFNIELNHETRYDLN